MRSLTPLLACLIALVQTSTLRAAQPFVHPGGLHNQADLDRMREKVAAQAHPWIDDWDKLCRDPLAQADYKAHPTANMGVSRQRASKDAHAAYLNVIRWYISGDTRYADCAIRICNAWSAATNEIPHGQDVPGLSGIPIAEFALVGEVLRVCPRWEPSDFNRFKGMMRTYWYPAVHGFLAAHNGPGDTHFWANWNICNIGSCIAIGVLLDDRAIFDEGVRYYRSDLGTGALKNAVYKLYPGNLGQWQESGRDQAHAELGVGLMAQLCEVAWKQGVDLYGDQDNRLLAGAEYVAQWDMWRPVPFTLYDNSDHAHQSWPSINARGRLNRPVWELLYNHYVVRRGLNAPNTQAMAQLLRCEGGSIDHFGYGTLAFTLDAAKSPFPPSPIPPIPSGLVAEAGVGRVFLRWTGSGETTQGYEIRRSSGTDPSPRTIASWNDNTRCEYTDADVHSGVRYDYVVAARNQAGTSDVCAVASATPAKADALPTGWSCEAIGNVVGADAGFADVSGGTFVLSGSGSGIGGTSDGLTFVSQAVDGDFSLTARISDVAWAKKGHGQKIGIMIRQSLAPQALTFLMKVGDIGMRQAAAGSRTAIGGPIQWTGGNDYTWIPAWFRLARKGDVVTAYESSDGRQWFEVATATMTMRGPCRVGTFVSSGTDEPITQAQFDHVTIDR